MKYLLDYLLSPSALVAVTIPWAYVLYWCSIEARKNPPDVTILWHWMICVAGSYFMSKWEVKDDYRELHIINGFFIYEAFYLYYGKTLTRSAAFSLVFLCDWSVDMVRAYQLIAMGEVNMETFYYGVGGAGIQDGLCLYSLLGGALVPYVAHRRKSKNLMPAGQLAMQ